MSVYLVINDLHWTILSGQLSHITFQSWKSLTYSNIISIPWASPVDDTILHSAQFSTSCTNSVVITPCACTRGKVIECVILSVAKKILRWCELAPSRTSEHTRSILKTLISYLYLLLGWFAFTCGDFSCFLIIRSILAAILFTAMSHAHSLHATCLQ